MKPTDENLIEIARDWAKEHPDFVSNFVFMLQEYRAVAETAGLDIETDLPFTKACLTQASTLFEKLEVFNG